MMPAAARRRAVEAMGLGPLWVRRGPTSDVVGETRTLSLTRTRVAADASATGGDFVVVGIAPAAHDDAGGPPTLDQDRLLDAMLAAIGRSRADRVPEDVATHRSFVASVLAPNAPKTIVVLGGPAAATLLGTDASLATLRQVEHALACGERMATVIVTHDPAHLLRTPADKAEAWADLCLARAAHDADAS